MPSRHIDVILWDSPDDEAIIGSAVSPRGLRFLREFSGNSEALYMKINVPPSELMAHIPPDVFVVFYREDGLMMPVGEQKSLQ